MRAIAQRENTLRPVDILIHLRNVTGRVNYSARTSFNRVTRRLFGATVNSFSRLSLDPARSLTISLRNERLQSETFYFRLLHFPPAAFR